MMRMVDIIEKKKLKGKLSDSEIAYFVKGYTSEEIPDYQASALMMAIWFNGLDRQETFSLTKYMADSGDKVDLSRIAGTKLDKHSTGGVADTTTLVLAPLVSACGVPIAKMSGRGLGHTGGTLDKLESIPGLKIGLSIEQIISNVNRHGICIAGQTGDLAPADKAMYALRDVTATVDCMPLIASSIMSKKIAAGADALVLDVKVGNGAFMKDLESARLLASIMVDIGNDAGIKTRAVISDMNQPLGMAIGNALEIIEAIEILKGMYGDSALKQVALELGANMLLLAGKCSSIDGAKTMLERAIDDGSGLNKLSEMIKAQGGNERVTQDISLLPHADFTNDVYAKKDGFLSAMDAEDIGRAAGLLGAGRQTKTDIIDPAVGIVMKVRLGGRVKTGDALCTMHYNDINLYNQAKRLFENSLTISQEPGPKGELIYETI